jgi:predicted transcriptional regulator
MTMPTFEDAITHLENDSQRTATRAETIRNAQASSSALARRLDSLHQHMRDQIQRAQNELAVAEANKKRIESALEKFHHSDEWLEIKDALFSGGKLYFEETLDMANSLSDLETRVLDEVNSVRQDDGVAELQEGEFISKLQAVRSEIVAERTKVYGTDEMDATVASANVIINSTDTSNPRPTMRAAQARVVAKLSPLRHAERELAFRHKQAAALPGVIEDVGRGAIEAHQKVEARLRELAQTTDSERTKLLLQACVAALVKIRFAHERLTSADDLDTGKFGTSEEVNRMDSYTTALDEYRAAYGNLLDKQNDLFDARVTLAENEAGLEEFWIDYEARVADLDPIDELLTTSS